MATQPKPEFPFGTVYEHYSKPGSSDVSYVSIVLGPSDSRYADGVETFTFWGPGRENFKHLSWDTLRDLVMEGRAIIVKRGSEE